MALLRPADVIRARTVEAYLVKARARAVKQGRDTRVDGRTLVPFVSEGRWVADCPGCRAGIVLHPEWGFAACLGRGCHRTYTSIAMPAEWRAIEAVLEERDLLNQNMLPGETLEDLRRENLAGGLKVP